MGEFILAGAIYPRQKKLEDKKFYRKIFRAQWCLQRSKNLVTIDRSDHVARI